MCFCACVYVDKNGHICDIQRADMTIPTILACHAQTLQAPHSALADSCLLCKGACDRGVWSCTRLVHSGIPLAAHVSPPTHGDARFIGFDHELPPHEQAVLPTGMTTIS